MGKMAASALLPQEMWIFGLNPLPTNWVAGCLPRTLKFENGGAGIKDCLDKADVMQTLLAQTKPGKK